MRNLPRSPIAALLVLTMFSTVLGQPVDCGAACSGNSCSAPSASKSCCGSCGNGGVCQCRQAGSSAAKKSCCEKSSPSKTASCCSSKRTANCAVQPHQAPGCTANCPCVRPAEFPLLPLEQQSKVADSLKQPVMNLGPIVAVLTETDEFSLGRLSLDDSPPPRAGLSLRIWICSWTT